MNPYPLSEDERRYFVYTLARHLVEKLGAAQFGEFPTERGDANLPIVDRLRQEGYRVVFDPGANDGTGGMWRVTKPA